MDAVLLSRIQFAFTVGFHFIFPPLTIGLSWFVVGMMGRYRKTGDEAYRHLTRFWTRILALTFVIGVATGFPMEFQFGTNWGNYSRFAGDTFGPALAAEVIFTFFLESTFLGVMIFGWDRVSRGTLWVSTWLVAIGATLSAFWITAANSWMQTPAAFQVRNGRAELTSFWGAIFNPSTIPRFLHTTDGTIITGALFVLGISAWFMLQNRHQETSRAIFVLALWTAFIASVLELGFGHIQAAQLAYTQPAKLAAAEGIFVTRGHMPLLLGGILDTRNETVHYAFRFPSLLSFLASGRTNKVILGLHAFPRNEWPPLALTFYPFHLMVILGLFFIGFSALGILLMYMRRLFTNRLYLTVCWLIIPLPFLSNELGWMTAEIGRQPWSVYHVFATRDAVSVSVPASHILASLVIFAMIYALLFVLWVGVLRREVRQGPEEEPAGKIPGESRV